MDSKDIALRLVSLRQRSHLSIRQLAAKAGVSAAMISYVERGQTALSLVTLEKILSALGTDLGRFFGEQTQPGDGPVFRREQMPLVADADRSYTLILPRREHIAVQMFDEQLKPGRKPQFETLECDVAGCVLSGTLMLEVKGKQPQAVRPGDAFYIRKGQTHRGFAHGKEPVRLISLSHPPIY